jgi:outer membrane protein
MSRRRPRGWTAGACLALAAGAAAWAQNEPPAPPPPGTQEPARIGTIFAQNAIVSTQEGQKAAAALTAKFDPKRAQFEQRQAELRNLQDALKRGGATMNADARAKLNQSIDAKSTELKRLSEDIQSQLEEEQGALVQQMGEKLIKVIDVYAKEKGLAIVLDVSSVQGPVIWAAANIDITNDIVKLYDKANPVPAQAPPPSPPAKK